MSKEEIKKIFRNLKSYENKIKTLNEEIEVLQSQAMKVTQSFNSEPGGGGVSSKVEDNVIKYEAKITKVRELEKIVKYAYEKLNSLKSYQRHLVLCCLVHHVPIKHMAYKEHTTPTNIYKIIDNALNKIAD